MAHGRVLKINVTAVLDDYMNCCSHEKRLSCVVYGQHQEEVEDNYKLDYFLLQRGEALDNFIDKEDLRTSLPATTSMHHETWTSRLLEVLIHKAGVSIVNATDNHLTLPLSTPREGHRWTAGQLMGTLRATITRLFQSIF